MIKRSSIVFEIPFYKKDEKAWLSEIQSYPDPAINEMFKKKAGGAWLHNAAVGYVYLFKNLGTLGTAYSKRDAKRIRRPYKAPFKFQGNLGLYCTPKNSDDFISFLDRIKKHDSLRGFYIDDQQARRMAKFISWGELLGGGKNYSSEGGYSDNEKNKIADELLKSGDSSVSREDVIRVLSFLD